MLDTLPYRAFFQFEFPIRHVPKPPRMTGDIRAWPRACRVPPLISVERHAEPVADVFFAWSDEGFHAAFDVHRSGPPRCDLVHWWKQDGLRLCIDTRDARDNKRATRFCHFFYLLPVGGGRDKRSPVVGLHRMSRAKEPPPEIDLSQVKVHSRCDRRGHTLETTIPATCLHGWDPAEHPRIGIFYKVRDTVRGDQHLTVNDELGWNVDPSTWATGVLVR